ncbi:hypothetical protein GCM10023205_74340 [Yinghuangia aomiensis]|uniref:Uncharacterized protein n=1 Tax=Yinghuangia aomiensis TaxID=676205 RepID=A0ABP9I8C9_9ACTN
MGREARHRLPKELRGERPRSERRKSERSASGNAAPEPPAPELSAIERVRSERLALERPEPERAAPEIPRSERPIRDREGRQRVSPQSAFRERAALERRPASDPARPDSPTPPPPPRRRRYLVWTVSLLIVALTLTTGTLVALSYTDSGRDGRDRFGPKFDTLPAAPLPSETFGFYRVDKDADGRWGLRTPDGRPFYSLGVDAVRPGEDTDRATGTCTYCAAMSAAYPDPADWISATTKRLGTWGFNTLGAGSDYAMFGPSFAYVPQLDFDGSWQPGGQSGTTHDWFDPAFADHAADVVRAKVAPLAVDPYLMGWYLDDKPNWGLGQSGSTTLLEAYLALPDGAPGRLMAEQYRGDPQGFVRAAARRYFEVTTRAVRQVDRHHLILGFRASLLSTPVEVVKEAGSWVDVFSVDAFQTTDEAKEFAATLGGSSVVAAEPDLRAFHELSGRPVLVSGFTALAADAGLPNTVPGAQLVDAGQNQRAERYAQVAQTFFDAPWIVGVHWFRYVDQPAGGRTPDGADGNVGVVGLDDQPWSVLTDRMSAVNAKAPYHDGYATPTP